jgi:hypothetical protein
MPDIPISSLTDGGVVQATDEIAVNRAGENRKVVVGDMAAEEAADYYTAAEVNALIAALEGAPEIVLVSADLTLDADLHDGRELYLVDGSPADYTITIPNDLPLGFRCSFFRVSTGDISIITGGSPVGTLNGIEGGTATIPVQESGFIPAAYLRQYDDGLWVIIGGGVVVA